MSNAPHDPNRPFTPPQGSGSQFQPAQKPPKPPMRKEAKIGWLILGGLGAVALIASAVSPNAENDTASTTQPSTVVTSVDNGPTPDPVTTPTNKPTAPTTTQPPAKPKATPKPTATQPAMTKSQEQAIGSAESYLSFTAFSRKGLIRQLSSDAGEGFSVVA